MKEGWTTRKFSDIFDLQMGKTPSRDNSSYWGGTNTWVSIADMNCGKYIYDTKEHITNSAVSESGIYRVSKDTVIMSFKLSIGKTAIATKDLYTNEAIMSFNTKEGFEILPDYIYYYLKGYKWQGMNKAVMGMTLNKKAISNNIFSYPNTLQQQHIVEELDLLSSIIEKKKAQLNELDNLAQSLFYEMFGDPITNEKGWEVKKMGEVCQSELGKTLNKSKDKGELYPYLCSINILWNNINMSILKQARFEKDEIERYSVKKGDLLVCEGGDIGRAAIWDREESMLYQNALHRIRFNNTITPVFCLFFLLNLKQKGVIDNRYGKGVTIKHLVKSSLLSIPIPIPPISLQQEFASKIETIEHQKELIKKSIKEVETLFNSRMDYYFN